LLYPKNRPDDEWGPNPYSTQIKRLDNVVLYGDLEARFITGRAASEDEGAVNAFFLFYFDGIDYDGDGMHDNHEIDFELLNSDRTAIHRSVYTDFYCDPNIELFHRVTARVDFNAAEVATGVWGGSKK